METQAQAQVRLVFRGELVEGHAPAEVKRRFGELFKFEGARLEAVFAGGSTVLKRALPRAEVERYVARLRQIGMHVHAEPLDEWPELPPLSSPFPELPAPTPAPVSAPVAAPMASTAPTALASAAQAAPDSVAVTPMATPPAAAPVTAPTAVAAAAAAAATPATSSSPEAAGTTAPGGLGLLAIEEEITCPNCNERQPKRFALCRKCSSDIALAIAHKKEESDRVLAERLAAREAKLGRSPAATRAQAKRKSRYATIDEVEAPPFLSLSFDGRLGRVSYFNSGFAAMAAVAGLAVLLAVLVPMLGAGLVVILLFLALIVLAVWSLRFTALRLHDMNRSGWWSLVTFIPGLGYALTIPLLMWPGDDDDNDYGAKPRQGNLMVAVALGVVALVTIGVAMQSYRGYVDRMAAAEEDESAGPSDGGRASARAARFLPTEAARDAYQHEYSGARTHKAFAVSQRGAWGFSHGQGSQREAARGALSQCETRREPYTPNCFVVNVDGMWANEN
jgi:uncharacterized membrane protein YhaH (DUF805 family)